MDGVHCDYDDGHGRGTVKGGNGLNKTYRGAYERMADRMIAGQAGTIEINWINMSAKEAGNGGADRVTAKLVAAGYRPDGSGCAERYRKAYEEGQKVDGCYIRLPQETWLRSA